MYPYQPLWPLQTAAGNGLSWDIGDIHTAQHARRFWQIWSFAAASQPSVTNLEAVLFSKKRATPAAYTGLE
jgi:hypothetical protein